MDNSIPRTDITEKNVVSFSYVIFIRRICKLDKTSNAVCIMHGR